MLFEVYGHNSHMFNFCLDEMLRRQQVSVAAASQWLCQDRVIGHLARDDMYYASFELVADRAVDMVRASLALRSQLGDIPALDEAADLSPTAEPQDHSMGGTSDERQTRPKRPAALHAAATAAADADADADAQGEEEVDFDEDEGDDDEDDDGRRGKRRKRLHTAEGGVASYTPAGGDTPDGDLVAEDADVDAEEDDEDPLWAAEEALKAAVRGSRSAYCSIIDALTAGIVAMRQRQQERKHDGRKSSASRMDAEEDEADAAAADGGDEDDVEDETAAWLTAAWSLLRRTLRTFHGNERSLSAEQQRPVLITAPTASLAAFMGRLSLSSEQQQLWGAAIANSTMLHQ